MGTVIIDYGVGNVRSIALALERVGCRALITCDPAEIETARNIILPGVGAFDSAINYIRDGGLDDVLHRKGQVEKVPILGICLGMQLFAESSEEGVEKGLSWIGGSVKKLPPSSDGSKYPVPHIGWNYPRGVRGTEFFKSALRFYFMHSMYFDPIDTNCVEAYTDYIFDFPSIITHENLTGVQFHPERSHADGLQLLQSFVNEGRIR